MRKNLVSLVSAGLFVASFLSQSYASNSNPPNSLQTQTNNYSMNNIEIAERARGISNLLIFSGGRLNE